MDEQFELSPEERVRDRARLAELRADPEWEGNWPCPYCGAPWVALHGLREHPDMWIGGSNVYGTVWHGWADH